MEIISRAEAKAKGLKRYFTGKACKYGHIAERWVSGGSCVKCVKEWQKANPEKTNTSTRKWRQTNLKKARDRSRKYYYDNREKFRENERKYRQANREKVRENDRKRRQANPKKVSESNRKYYQANREKENERSRKYYHANREKFREYNRLRYARLKKIKETFTIEQILDLRMKQNNKCAHCQKTFKLKRLCTCHSCRQIKDKKSLGKDDRCYEIDHKYPISKAEEGRVYEIYDMQLLCPPCNTSKNDKEELDFLQQNGKLL